MKKTFAILLFLSIFPASLTAETPDDSAKYKQARQEMVSKQIRRRGISDPAVLEAIRAVPRHFFVPRHQIKQAYTDRPLAIGEGQTISQPYIVALMSESLKLEGDDHVLEIGTGSGYQAAVLSKIVSQVYTIEIKEKLHLKSKKLLESIEFDNISTRHGDGYFGWQSAAPFDCIMITAAVDHIPPPLLKQLKNGGKLILPLGNPFNYQNLTLVTREDDNFIVKQITGVLFVPMTGYALKQDR
ncbi:protein-L-isoaspartate(D-aspartate) O-methyltransferase [Thermodesulfobacteriota bacterium]